MPVKDLKELKEPSKKELELALQDTRKPHRRVRHHRVQGHIRENVEKLIKKKLKGETIKVEKPEKKEEVKELMVALEETLAQMKK